MKTKLQRNVALALGNQSAMDGATFVNSLNPVAWFRQGQGITITGSGVSSWADATGLGHHLLQGTDAARPALQADGSILFNGTSHFLKCSAFTLNQPETVFILFKSVSWTNQDHIYDGNTLNNVLLYQNGSTPQLNIYAGSPTGSVTSLAVGAYGVTAAVINGASSSLQHNLNTPATGNAGAGNRSGFTLGAAGDGSLPANIQVLEVIIFPTAHDATTRARVANYLRGVGGVAF